MLGPHLGRTNDRNGSLPYLVACCNISPGHHAGREIRESMFDQVSDLIHALDAGMMPISVFFPYLPIPAHNNRDR